MIAEIIGIDVQVVESQMGIRRKGPDKLKAVAECIRLLRTVTEYGGTCCHKNFVNPNDVPTG